MITSPLRLQTPAPPASDAKHQALKKATQQFESYFLQEMLKEMRKTVPHDKLLGDDGHGQEIFRDMMDQSLSESMAARGDLGMARMMYDQLAPGLGPDAAKAADKTPEPGKTPELDKTPKLDKTPEPDKKG